MFGVDDLILGGLAAGGSLLSGIGGNKAAKKQNKIAAAKQAETNRTNQNIQLVTNWKNQELQAQKNAFDATLGQSLVARGDAAMASASALPGIDLAGFLKARDASGYNPVTWLNSGALSLFDNRSAKQAAISQATSFISQGMALQSPGMTTWGQTLEGTSPTVSEPSMLSAVGGAISSGATMLNSANQNTQRIAEDAAKQTQMISYLQSVQAARKSGNALAGLGTPSFETSSGASGATVAAVAAKLKKDAALSPYGYEYEKQTINPGNVDPSNPNPLGGRGVLSGLTDGFYTSVFDWYWKLAGRNMGADAAIATDNYFKGPQFKTTGPLDENARRQSTPSDNTGLYKAPLNWFEWLDQEVFSTRPAY